MKKKVGYKNNKQAGRDRYKLDTTTFMILNINNINKCRKTFSKSELTEKSTKILSCIGNAEFLPEPGSRYSQGMRRLMRDI